MTVITVERLEKSRALIDDGFTCDSITLDPAKGFSVEPKAVQWLKDNHYQLKVAETFGETGIALLVYPAE